ncbi:MAG: hypothetical protein WCJ36_00855 [Candidatus Saccharibacteria bacterium]
MNKTVILFFATIFELAGNSIPMLFGDSGFLSLWGIVGGLIGGLFGIWVGVVVSKRLG